MEGGKTDEEGNDDQIDEEINVIHQLYVNENRKRHKIGIGTHQIRQLTRIDGASRAAGQKERLSVNTVDKHGSHHGSKLNAQCLAIHPRHPANYRHEGDEERIYDAL